MSLSVSPPPALSRFPSLSPSFSSYCQTLGATFVKQVSPSLVLLFGTSFRKL